MSSGGYPWISSQGHANRPHPPAKPSRTLTVQIGRWGNVLAVRLPQALSKLLHLQQGDAFQLQLLSSGEVLLTPRTRRSRIALADQLQRLQDHDRQVSP
jgi:antitoxin component of MazEF toxin-antitoxin module